MGSFVAETMAEETVLLTGATGNVGTITLEHLLIANHNVNIVLRNSKTAIPLFESKFPSAVLSGQLRFTSIPDMTVPGSFDAAATTATSIIHIATPLGGSNFLKDMIEPTWAIDRNVLEAARKSNSVRRLVICGTLLQALRPDTDMFNTSLTIAEDRFNDIALEDAQDAWSPAYWFSKTNAERKMWEWMAETKKDGGLDFDVVMLLPPLITGRSPQFGFRPNVDAAGGTPWVYRVLMVTKTEQEVDGIIPFFMDTDDVARTHVLALAREKVPGNQRYILTSDEMLDLRAAARRLRAEYPELEHRIPDLEEKPSLKAKDKFVKIDTSKADKVFGKGWKSGYESVRDVVLDVVQWEKENAGTP